MKLLYERTRLQRAFKSLPVRGAWIEISICCVVVTPMLSLPVRGAWIEIFLSVLQVGIPTRSLPVRGAWIEICSSNCISLPIWVAPRAGSVD